MSRNITTGVWRWIARHEAETGEKPDPAALADARPMSTSCLEIDRSDGIPDPDEWVVCGAWGPGGECARMVGHMDDGIPYHRDEHYSWDTDEFKSWPVGWRSEREQLAAAEARIAELEAS